MTGLKSHRHRRWSAGKALKRMGLLLSVMSIAAGLTLLVWSFFRSSPAPTSSPTGPTWPAPQRVISTEPIKPDEVAQYVVPADQPRILRIERLGLEARVIQVGVTAAGNIDTPDNVNDVAWYNGSAKPGADGTVFLDGHLGAGSVIGVFQRLYELVAGDPIDIELGDGTVRHYQVVHSETVADDSVDMAKALQPAEGTKGLTLMTCAGKFERTTQTYTHRFIVYAVQQ